MYDLSVGSLHSDYLREVTSIDVLSDLQKNKINFMYGFSNTFYVLSRKQVWGASTEKKTSEDE